MKSKTWESLSIYTSIFMFIFMSCCILPTTICSISNMSSFSLVNPNKLSEKLVGNYSLIISCILLGVVVPVNSLRQFYFKKQQLKTIGIKDEENKIQKNRNDSKLMFCVAFIIIDSIILIVTLTSLIVYIIAEIEFPGKWENVDIEDVKTYEKNVCFLFLFESCQLK